MNAEGRVWEVVLRAFEEREPQRRPRRALHAAAAVAVVSAALVVAAALSPPGHAVFERVKHAVGVEDAARHLGPLPAPGRLLVVVPSGGDVWVVDRNGTKRSLGTWGDAVWSPHGRYVLATRPAGIAALDTNGKVRWSLAAPGAADPAWEGTRTDTRIAFHARDGLHVVAGDGTGDRVLDAHPAPAPAVWDPASLHVLAYESGHALVLRDVDRDRILWRAPLRAYGRLAWSSDGRRVAVVAPGGIEILDGSGRVLRTLRGRGIEHALFRPGTHALTIARHRANRSEVETVDVDRPGRGQLLFAGPGAFGDLVWSPDGSWLLVDWRTANQWVFLHGRAVRAVGQIEQQFPRSGDQPSSLAIQDGWCCPAGAASR